MMNALLAASRAIDAVNERVGRVVLWAVLAVTLISAGNAIVRKTLGMSSNGWLEIQWYLFGAVFMLAAGYTLKHNGHVRIDVIYSHLSQRVQAWIDLIGALLFLLPFCVLMTYLSWPSFIGSFASGETSSDPGGLIRWPVRLLIPLGFVLLVFQGLSEITKRIAFLRHGIPFVQERPQEEV